MNPDTTSTQNAENRQELISRARSFLLNPNIRYQDAAAKRHFLAEKGLNEAEIDQVIRELPPVVPSIPPRTYPQPPPSNLPNLLLGLTRIFSWLAGGSAALLLVYYSVLLPRITRTTSARRSLRSHHVALLRNLTTSLASLKESQAESYAALPRADPFKEPHTFTAHQSIKAVLEHIESEHIQTEEIPPATLLRCGIADYGQIHEGDEHRPTTEELFRLLEGNIPWLVTDDGAKYQQTLWDTLSTSPYFTASDEEVDTTPPSTRWTFTPPPPMTESPLTKSLANLAATLPKKPGLRPTLYQHTLQTLSDFTGYISTQLYQPYNASGWAHSGGSLSPAQEEVRKEIRALKGLALNRRTFMPAVPRTLSAPVS